MSRMDILVARQYEKDGETKTYFVKIGTAWPMQNREGFSLSFDALPTPSLSDQGKVETRALMMPPKDDSSTSPRGPQGYPRDKGTRQIADTDPDAIPF